MLRSLPTPPSRPGPHYSSLHSPCALIHPLPLPTALRILRGLPQIINGGRFFDKDGNRVPQPGQRYAPNGVRLQLPQQAPER